MPEVPRKPERAGSMSDNERALGGLAKRRTPARGLTAVPVEVDEETSANYSGPELSEFRSRRPTPERVSRLEVKHDQLAAIVTDTRVVVGRMDEKLDAIATTFAEHQEERRQERKEARQFWRAVALKAFGAVCSGTVVLAALRHWGVL